MELSVEGAPKLRVGDWVRAITLAFIVTMCLGILAAMSYPRLSDAIFLLGWPGLTYGMVTYHRLTAARHTQQLKEVRERVLRQALSRLPDGLAGAMQQPLQRLVSNMLSYEGAFQNRRLPPQKIQQLLWGWLSALLYNRDQALQIPNLLTSKAGGEATFSLPLYRLHAHVAGAVDQVIHLMLQTVASSPDGRPFPRLCWKLKRTYYRLNGEDPDSLEEPRKELKWPSQCKGISPAELLSLLLADTPFFDFFHTKVAVSLPHKSRFEHTEIVAGSGHGKTQLLQYLILHDLPHVAAGNRTVIVLDSQGDLIRNILSLASVGAMADRVVLIDPTEYTPALNLFDFGLDRLTGYALSERERKRILYGAIELYKYLFGALLGAEPTPRQTLIFEYLARLMMVVPGATIDTLLDFMKQPETTRAYLAKLDETSRRFFATEFFDRKYDGNREQLATRLWEVKSKTELAQMFAAERNLLDMADAMNRGSLILINTAKDFLKFEASAIFGRFFIALIGQSTLERQQIAPTNRRETFVYIDEAHEYFDERLGNLFEQIRKHMVGLLIAHQDLGQFDHKLRETVMANTAIKLVGGLSAHDARAFAEEMWCKPEFLLGMQKSQKQTEFACYIKNIEGLKRAIPLRVPLGELDRQPKITAAKLASLKEANRARYGASYEHPPEKPKVNNSPLGHPELL